MNKLLYFGLVIGAAVAGAAVALYYTKNTERKRADEEIAQMREYYAQKEEKTGKTSTETENKNTKSQEMRNYQKIVKENYNYERTPDGPTAITPDEFGENPGYDKLSMTFYADNIVADENDEIVEDVNDCIGFENLAHMGEYEPDILYVKNDRLRVYYEITRDLRKYEDVAGSLPYSPGVT